MQNNIDKVLRQKGKTVTWLASQIGLPKKHSIYKYCENLQQPSAFNMFKIAKALGVTVEELISE